MIVVRVHRAAGAGGVPPRMWKPSGRSSASAPSARKPADQRRDAIAFLDAQLAGARHA